jgi:hypothetical protein
MSKPAATAADPVSSCYREIACAIREIIPTLRHIKSKEELESVAACYERLAEHRDDACMIVESAGEAQAGMNSGLPHLQRPDRRSR